MVASQPFDPLEYLHVAVALTDQDPSEADLRTAIGRLYYAVFLLARESLGVVGRSRIHGRVIGEVARIDRVAAVELEKLFDLRILADYNLDVQDPLRNDWQRNYQMARRLANFVLERLR